MELRALSKEQREGLRELVGNHRIKTVPVDAVRATTFFTKASKRMAEINKLSWAEGRYNYAYDAAHDVGEAVMAAYGYRTANGPGQHEAIGRFLRVIFTDPPGQRGAKRFDRMRRARNQLRYEMEIVGEADADVAVRAASDLLAGAREIGLSE